jgi:hypothetical protein
MARIAIAAVVLLAAACSGRRSHAGSGGPPNAPGPAASPSLIGFSHCMRSHGVPKFPDPGSGGIYPKGGPTVLGVSNSQFNAARTACQRLLPNTINGASIERCESAGACSRTMTQAILKACCHSPGACAPTECRTGPIPAPDSVGRVAFPISIGKDGFDPNSPQVGTRKNECGHMVHLPVGVPLAVSP